MGTVIIRLEKVSKSHDTIGQVSVPAVHDLDLSIESGEMVAVIGAPGSGTSTLMNILGCLAMPTSGRYILDGQDLSRLSKRRLNKVRATAVGFAFHLADLRADTDVQRNVELPMVFTLRPRIRHRRALEALALVGLEGHGSDMPVELTPVQRRRAIIARAIINRPAVLLQDEPTADLDEADGREILELLDVLHTGGTTVVYSTRDPQVAARAHRVVHLVDGRIEDIEPTIGSRRDTDPATGIHRGDS